MVAGRNIKSVLNKTLDIRLSTFNRRRKLNGRACKFPLMGLDLVLRVRGELEILSEARTINHNSVGSSPGSCTKDAREIAEVSLGSRRKVHC